MKKIQYILSFLFINASISCQDQLDILNPNFPSPESAVNEAGIVALAQGGVYLNGFRFTKFGGSFQGLVFNYHDLMGDIVGAGLANNGLNQVGSPSFVTLDDGTVLANPLLPPNQKDFLRSINEIQTQANPQYFEWALMYNMNNAMNNVLTSLNKVELNLNKERTLRVWAHFWKGFAYSRIGSMYVAGIVTDYPNQTNNRYVGRVQILAEADAHLFTADTILNNVVASQEYNEVMNELIPSPCKVGKGFAMTTLEWKRHINSLRARNILVNTPVNDMTPAQWNEILVLAGNGVQVGDRTYTLRSDAQQLVIGGFFPAGSIGNGASITTISERLIQDFKSGDLRFSNNFSLRASPIIVSNSYGISFSTRYAIVNQGKNMPGALVYVSNIPGAQEIYLSSTYEENLLMLSEAEIRTGAIDAGLARIDELRTYQGAGLAPVSGTGLTIDQALEELRRERRVALAFRGFAFYDARRWGVIKNGRTGCVVISSNGNLNTNATIRYDFMDYWDVPVAESYFNPPSPDSAPIVNPN
jgi:hypothetical protein